MEITVRNNGQYKQVNLQHNQMDLDLGLFDCNEATELANHLLEVAEELTGKNYTTKEE